MIRELGEDTQHHIRQSSEPEEELIIDNVTDIEHEAIDKKEKGTLAKKFINLIGQGYKPGQAAKLVGASVKGLMSSSRIQKEVKELLETYTLGADIRRQLVRAGMNQLAIENLGADGDKKIALDALKAIGSDTEVGINAPPQVALQINVGALENIFADIPEPDKIEEKKGEIIDVEFVDAGELQKLAPSEEQKENDKDGSQSKCYLEEKV